MVYELVDRESGSLLGEYADQDAALVAVLVTIKYSGEEAAETLLLAVDDPTGTTAGGLIAQGADLVRMARDRWQLEHPAAATAAD